MLVLFFCENTFFSSLEKDLLNKFNMIIVNFTFSICSKQFYYKNIFAM